MPFVLDNSVAMSWCFEDESTPYADHVLGLLGNDTARTPAIWPLEAANAVIMGERRQRLQEADVTRFIHLILSLPIVVENSDLTVSITSIMDTAREYSITTYDASYLELAMREGLPLATQDARLSSAAENAGVHLLA